MERKHPKALPYLFLTEMWERFSYYGVTAILILYMDKTFGLNQSDIYSIYGAYGALIYMTPLLGGILADKFLGSYRTVLWGAVLIMIGHFVVAIYDSYHYFFYLGLAIIILGTGLFIPNINAIVGFLYHQGDKRRDSGFTLAYMGRNIGTIAAPIVCAWLAAFYDWRVAFIVAGIGMLIGIFTFRKSKPFLDGKSFIAKGNINAKLLLVLLFAVTLFLFVSLLYASLVGELLFLVTSGFVIWLLYLAFKEPLIIRKRIFVAMILISFYIVFMILLQQSGGALNLFTDRFVDKTWLSIHFETGMFQAVEPLVLVILSPILSWFWLFLAKKNYSLNDGTKFVIALIFMSFSFVLLALAMFQTNAYGQISMHWLNAAYALQALSELFIGPIGLAMISRLIPQHLIGLFMGMWVLASAIANFIAARIGAWVTPEKGFSGKALDSIIYNYQWAFFKLAFLGFLAAIILALCVPILRNLTKPVEETKY